MCTIHVCPQIAPLLPALALHDEARAAKAVLRAAAELPEVAVALAAHGRIALLLAH